MSRDERSEQFKVVDGFSGLTHHSDGRVEWSGPSRVQPGLTLPGDDQTMPGPWGDSDESLKRLVRECTRAIEDTGFDPKNPRARAAAMDRWTIQEMQKVRLRLRMRYGARDPYGPPGDRGTDVYDHYMRLDQPPSYALAAAIDRARRAGEAG